MHRVGQMLSILFIVLVVVVAAAAIFYSSGSSSKQQAEQPETRVTVEPAAPGGTPVATGGGGEIQGGWYQLYFTAPQYPDNAQTHRGGLDEKLVALIDQAQKSVDVADYDFDLGNVADALVRAKNRGARVRMVTDSDTLANIKDQAIQGAFAKLVISQRCIPKRIALASAVADFTSDGKMLFIELDGFARLTQIRVGCA